MLRSFNGNAVHYHRAIRELLDEDRDAFRESVVRILRSETDSPAAQYLLALLVSGNLVRKKTGDSALNPEQRLILSRMTVRVRCGPI
jgi:hypothetical protein